MTAPVREERSPARSGSSVEASSAPPRGNGRAYWATKLAWPSAFVVAVALASIAATKITSELALDRGTVRIEHPTPTVVHGLRELSRLETLTLHVEKIIEVKDHQKRLYGLVEASDAVLFVASGEVVLGVDLGKLRDADARFDATTQTAYIALPAPELLSSRFDEPHSYVHARTTDVLAKRNEGLESIARQDALAAFEATAKEPKTIARAKAQAEKQVEHLARAWGAKNVIVTWQSEGARGGDGDVGMATR